MRKIKLLLGVFTISAAVALTACDGSTNGNVSGSSGGEDNVFKEGQAGDTTNNMNNGGNYTPDVRQDDRGGIRTGDSTYGTTGSKFDASGNPVTGNGDVNSNRQQGTNTGSQSTTERRKAGE